MGGDCLAGEHIDLQGADNPLFIGWMEKCRPIRINLSQVREQYITAECIIFFIQGSTQYIIFGAGAKGPAGEQGINIKSRAAHQNRNATAAENILTAGSGILHIAGDGIILHRICHINHMMRYGRLLFSGGFGGADIHAAVDLHRVGRDDLAAQRFGKNDAQVRFSAGRWACHHQHFFTAHTMRLKSLSRSFRVMTEETGRPWGQ